ncbi:hypothetical protein WJX77_007830 [Trebouxia sp. C0004]
MNEQSSSAAPSFVTLKSVGIPDVSETPSYASRTSSQLLHRLSWEWQSRKRVLNGIAVRVATEDGKGRPTRSGHRTRPLWQLDDNYDHGSADAKQPAAQTGTEPLALHAPEQDDSERAKVTPRDPNIVGFVPAFILGNVYICNLFDSADDQIKEGRLEESTDSTEAPYRSRVSVATHLSLLLAMGSMTPAAGLVGLFASKAVAQLVARQAYKQIKPAAPDMPATERTPAGNPIANTLQRAARGIVDRAERLLQIKPGSKQGEEDSEDAEMRTGMKDAISRAETAMAQAEGILKQLDQAAEELFLEELSVMPMPLALALDLVMSHPNRVRLVGPSSKGKVKAQKASKQKHRGKSDAGDASVQPGMVTYTIPGITFGMPSSVGPLHFAPVFTSRHTAEIAWDVVREMLILRHVQKRKLRRHLKRHITEMGVALLTGLQSRVETQDLNEDEEGMSEPAEVADFLNELGESDNSPSKNKTRFRPRGPLDLLGALACGVVSLYARTMEWGGDAADEVLFHSPIGQRAVGMSGRPAIEELPLQDAIASARDWNRALQQTALARQAIAVQQASRAQQVLDEPASDSNGQGETFADPGEQPERQHDAPVQQHSQSKSQSGAKSQPGVEPQPQSQPEAQPPLAPQQEQQPSGNQQQQQQQQQRSSVEQEQQQQQQQQAEVQEGQQKVHEVAAEAPGPGQVLQMPPSLPFADDLRCVLGSGERLTMLDGLQGMLAGLAVKVLTSAPTTGPGLGDKVESPFEIPIYSLKGAQSGTTIDDSMADGTTASVHFDLPLATGRKKTAAKEKNKKTNSAESLQGRLVVV